MLTSTLALTKTITKVNDNQITSMQVRAKVSTANKRLPLGLNGDGSNSRSCYCRSRRGQQIGKRRYVEWGCRIILEIIVKFTVLVWGVNEGPTVTVADPWSVARAAAQGGQRKQSKTEYELVGQQSAGQGAYKGGRLQECYSAGCHWRRLWRWGGPTVVEGKTAIAILVQ